MARKPAASDAPPAPVEHATQGAYMADEKARQAAGEPPGPAPIYPLSALPQIIPPRSPAAQAVLAADSMALLRMYPQTINADFLTPMTQVIDEAEASGDMTGVYLYAAWIPQELGIGLAQLAHEAAGDLPPPVPVLTTITGAVVTDNSPADSASINTVQFTATDADGLPMAAPLDFTADSATAPLTPASGTTGADGTFSVDLIDSVAETVTVTATGGTVTGSASVTFVVVP